jgi:flagellar protein FliS
MSAASSQFTQAYQRARAETANPVQLVLMLYDGAIRFLSVAREKMTTEELEARHTNLLKAQRIIAELLASLDKENGGEVAANLSRLYTFMLQELVEANLHDRSEPIETVIGMLRELRGAWAEVESQQKQEAA